MARLLLFWERPAIDGGRSAALQCVPQRDLLCRNVPQIEALFLSRNKPGFKLCFWEAGKTIFLKNSSILQPLARYLSLFLQLYRRF